MTMKLHRLTTDGSITAREYTTPNRVWTDVCRDGKPLFKVDAGFGVIVRAEWRGYLKGEQAGYAKGLTQGLRQASQIVKGVR